MSSSETPGGGDDQQAVSQLATMISRGRSFSGRERNCTFLNLRDHSGGSTPSFANVSAGSGLDFDDDGRALALADWDHDGDLDLWVSNRTAPRLRLMRNDSPLGTSHFLNLRLQGNGAGTNRDAIGGRVDVTTATGKTIRSLRAGGGFIAQSSKWLHFGLGDADRIEKVVVRWPDSAGTEETFAGIEVDGRYVLFQGTGEADSPPRRAPVTLQASDQKIPPATRTARIPMVILLKAPALSISDQSGKTVQLGAGKPVLVNLWASWCAPCLVELAEIGRREADIRAAGIDVIALSVDALDSDDPDIAAAAAGLAIQNLKFPFISAIASEQIVGQLQWHHDNAVGRKRRLPLPSSFLIDAQGFVSVIYKGPVSVDQLLADVAHSDGTRFERWVRSAPVAGRAIDHESIHATAAKMDANLFFHHAQHQESLGATDLAEHYYSESLRCWPDSGRAHRGLGNLYAKRAQWLAALAQFDELIEIEPQDAPARYAAAVCHQQLGQPGAARVRFEETINLQANHVPALDALGTMDLLANNAPGAIRHFRAVLQAAPTHASARNNLAWILATCRDDSLRDGAEALELAVKLVEADQGKTAMFYDTLAAAQAELGRFKDAITTARQGLQLARDAKEVDKIMQIEKHIAAYERGEALRE